MTRPCKWRDGISGSVCMSRSIQPDLPVWRTVGLPRLINWPPISDGGAISEVAGPQVTSIAAYRGGCSRDGLARLGRIWFSWSGIESSLEHEVLNQLAFCAWNRPVSLLFWMSFAGIFSQHVQRRIVGLERCISCFGIRRTLLRRCHWPRGLDSRDCKVSALKRPSTIRGRAGVTPLLHICLDQSLRR
jgi:hypothetical protein